MDIVPIVVANERHSSFEPLTGGLKSSIRLGGKPLYRYVADILYKIFGRVFIASSEYMEGPYNFLEVKGTSAEEAIAAAEELMASADRLLIADGSIIVEEGAVKALIETMMSAGVESGALGVPTRGVRGLPLEVGAGNLLRGVGGESQLLYGGIAILPRRAVKLAQDGLKFSSILRELSSNGVAVAVWSGRWLKVEEPVDLIDALELVAPSSTFISSKAKISPTAVIEGPVFVDEGAEIDHYAVIKGPAYIGRNAFVGAHALVRNFADLEEGAVVGSSAEITHSLVGPEATVGRGSFVSYSVVGAGAVLEPNVATRSVLREGRTRLRPIEVRGREFYKLGALIGRGERISAGAVLEPGRGF